MMGGEGREGTRGTHGGGALRGHASGRARGVCCAERRRGAHEHISRWARGQPGRPAGAAEAAPGLLRTKSRRFNASKSGSMGPGGRGGARYAGGMTKAPGSVELTCLELCVVFPQSRCVRDIAPSMPTLLLLHLH